MAFVRHKSDSVFFLSQAIHIMYILRLLFFNLRKMYLFANFMYALEWLILINTFEF